MSGFDCDSIDGQIAKWNYSNLQCFLCYLCGQSKVVLLHAAIASCYCLLLCCRGDDEGVMAQPRDGSVRSREESAGRSSFLLLLPAIARCCVVEATMRA